ncbi:MAG: cyclic nucleotide-binding domain-containing protein, partial [Proteobacteria bacterium]|nr:cyclic nucleotide-binding domain-containing protein [Pseudomonadota bacterium]
MSVEDFLKSAYLTSQETYPQGEAIFDEGSSGDWIYVVLKGQVEIFKMAKGKRIVVDMLKEGDVFGEVSFIDKQPRSAGARAQTEVVLGVIDVDFLVSEYNKLPNHFRL